MSLESLVPLLVFLFPLAYSPGPGNAFFAGIGASRGLRAAGPALIGYHVATFVVTVAIGLGMGATILRDPVGAKVVAGVGSAYVLWLAWTFTRAGRARSSASAGSEPREARIGVWAGAVVLLFNPKAYYIIAVMFVQFLRVDDGGAISAVLAVATVFTLNNAVAFLAWTALGSALTALFRSARSRLIIDYVCAATLVAVAVWMAAPLFA